MLQHGVLERDKQESPGRLRCELFFGDRCGDLNWTSVPFSISNIQYPTRNVQKGSRGRIAALLQAIFPFLDHWIFLVGYWIFKEGLSNLVTTYNVTTDFRNRSSFGNLGKQRIKMLHSVAWKGDGN